MQISDAPPAQPGSPAPKEEVRSGGDEAGREAARNDGPRAGRRFRETLERGRRGSTAGDRTDDVELAAAMAGWFRAESAQPPAGHAPPAKAGAAAVDGARAADRVLIGSGPGGAQARIRIGAGALAGTEIQLSGGAGGHAVEARLLTQTASSRQTLSVVMDEIRSRLRDRGIVLSLRATPARPSAPAADFDESGGEPARAAAYAAAAGASAGTRR